MTPSPIFIKFYNSLRPSFLSVLAGWAAGVTAFAFVAVLFVHPVLILLAMLVGLYSAPPILIVWLILLWPLHSLIPRTSVVWRSAVCVPCGVVAGSLLAAPAIRLFGGDFAVFIFPFAPLIGGVACAVACKLNTLEPDYHKPPALPSWSKCFAAFGHRLARRFMDYFQQLSGQ